MSAIRLTRSKAPAYVAVHNSLVVAVDLGASCHNIGSRGCKKVNLGTNERWENISEFGWKYLDPPQFKQKKLDLSMPDSRWTFLVVRIQVG